MSRFTIPTHLKHKPVLYIDDYEKIDGQTLRTALYQAMSELNEREQKIIKLRFGLEDEKPMKLSDVSVLLGVSSERVRQIEFKALTKIRSSLKGNSFFPNGDHN